MTQHLAYFLYLLSLVFASACCIYNFKKLDTASKILAVLVCCALVNEGAAYYLSQKYKNNLPLYAIYCFFEFGMLCIYFNKVIDLFIKKNIGIYIAIIGIVLGIFNLAFVQNINSLNSYFLFLEGLSVIGMSLFAFFRLLLKHDSLHLSKYHHFWFISILVFFWSITFLYWGLSDYVNQRFQSIAWKINFANLLAGVVTYGGFGIVYLLYPKMQKGNE
jgi:hypothetical protein